MTDGQIDHISMCEWDDKLHCRGLQIAVDVFSMVAMGAYYNHAQATLIPDPSV